VFDVARGLRTRFTFDPADDYFPIWSPDGSRIVFSSFRKGSLDLYEKASNGAGPEQLVLGNGGGATSWSPDGRVIAYTYNANAERDVWVLPLDGDRKPVAVVQTPFHEVSGMFSPDGHWLAYQSNESGPFEVYVMPFPGPGGKWQVSTAGGTEPRWRRDGQELFYLGLDGTLMVAAVKSGGGFDVGAVQSLFQARPRTGKGSPYDVSADGQRFLINTLPVLTDRPPFTVVFNWTAGLKK
jgi:Tol biopolymer transport system component